MTQRTESISRSEGDGGRGRAARFPRILVAWCVALVTCAFSLTAVAGAYLDRAGLLVKQARYEADYLELRSKNHELAELVHQMAAARLSAARDGLVPKEVMQAHPHLLLMLENYERSADAAESGQADRFVVYQRRARDEEQIFRSIMRQLGFPLEDERKK